MIAALSRATVANSLNCADIHHGEQMLAQGERRARCCPSEDVVAGGGT